MSLPPIGTQLLIFSATHNIETDIEAILDTLASAGYDAVEGGPSDAARYKPMLEARGLRYGGSHVGLPALQDVESHIQYLKTIGASDICNSGLMKWNDLSAGHYREAIPILNEVGRRFRDEGIHLHYHNHAFEWDKVDGNKTGMDLLMDGLNFDVVDLCVDVAWVQKGGDDPAHYLQQHVERIGYLHFKDFNADGWCELGRGEVDFEPIMKLLPSMPKVRWVMVEQDTTRIDPHESVRISRTFLKERFGY